MIVILAAILRDAGLQADSVSPDRLR